MNGLQHVGVAFVLAAMFLALMSRSKAGNLIAVVLALAFALGVIWHYVEVK